jgi:hypothetical protein
MVSYTNTHEIMKKQALPAHVFTPSPRLRGEGIKRRAQTTQNAHNLDAIALAPIFFSGGAALATQVMPRQSAISYDRGVS